MAEMEQLQMNRYLEELEDDVRHLVEKYQRIMGWSVPELDDAAARRVILDAAHRAIQKPDYRSASG